MSDADFSDPALWDRLRHIANVLMMSGYDSVAVRPSPRKDGSIIFSIQIDEWTNKGARIRAWRLAAMTDLQVIAEIKDQIETKWKRT